VKYCFYTTPLSVSKTRIEKDEKQLKI